MLHAMPSERVKKRVESYLLRVHEESVVVVKRRYELLNLATQQTQSFASLSALRHHLAGDEPVAKTKVGTKPLTPK